MLKIRYRSGRRECHRKLAGDVEKGATAFLMALEDGRIA
jgi:hypothetical protein